MVATIDMATYEKICEALGHYYLPIRTDRNLNDQGILNVVVGVAPVSDWGYNLVLRVEDGS
jgi:hypothetical protein